MKRLPTNFIDAMTIFGVGIAMGLFGLSLIERASTFFSPNAAYTIGFILVVLGLIYCALSAYQSWAKE